MNTIEIPNELKSYLEVEDCSNFKEDRYYISEDIQTLYDTIISNQRTCKRIHELGFSYLNAALLFGLPGTGKAQPLYSKVLTPNGFKPMRELKIGDYVLTPDGKKSKILGIYPQGEKDIYEIHFNDGSKCRCSNEHLWTLQNRNDRVNNKYRTVELKDIKEQLYEKKEPNRKIYSIDYIDKISFQSRKYSIHPYIMGVLLGDGCLSTSSISVSLPETEMRNHFEEFCSLKLSPIKSAPNKDFLIVENLGSGNSKTNSLKESLKEYGLLGKRSHEKFIPKDYLIGSYEQRLWLLRGLLDTDAYAYASGIEYSTTSPQLCQDIRELVYSLGGYATYKEKTSFYKKNNTKIPCKPSYRITIQFPSEMDSVFYLSRKNNKYTPKRNKRIFKRFIESIEYIGKENCQCIYIDNPNHLYITDDYIITHNTHFSRYVAYKQDLPFVYVSFAKMMGGYGEANKIISDIFKYIANVKCVFMLDEIDCIARKRAKEASDTALTMAGTTITIMQEFDYYRSHNVESIILAATNRADTLDEALLSRFALKHEMLPLSSIDKERFLTNALKDADIPYDENNIYEYCSENFNLEQRNMELDMIQGISKWIEGGEVGNVHIEHIK